MSVMENKQVANDAGGLISDKEALQRLIEYAWVEAERSGEDACANLLSRALLSLKTPFVDLKVWHDNGGSLKSLAS